MIITQENIKTELSINLFIYSDYIDLEIQERIQNLLIDLFYISLISRLTDEYSFFKFDDYKKNITLYFRKVGSGSISMKTAFDKYSGEQKCYTHMLTLPIEFLNNEHEDLESYLKPMFINNPFK